MQQPLVSVVTPVYNGELYLAECIESVLSQNYSNWEYVIVDNCSSDSTPQIIARFAATDERIRIVRNPHTVGALQNHNIAMRSIGEGSSYCKLLHADDRLLTGCLERMVKLAEQHPSIGMVGSYSQWGTQTVGRGLPGCEDFFSGREVGRLSLLQQVNPFWSPSCHLHRTEAVLEREFFYDEENLHADVQSSYEILSKWDFGFVHDTLTYIRAHGESRTSTLANPLKKTLATNLDMLIEYGPLFLSDSEFEGQLKRQLEHYYQNLAISLFELREAQFWQYHQGELLKMGQEMSKSKLLKSALVEFVSSPLRNCRRVARGLRGRLRLRRSGE